MLPTHLQRTSIAAVKDQKKNQRQSTTFDVLMPNATATGSKLTRSSKPWAYTNFQNSLINTKCPA